MHQDHSGGRLTIAEPLTGSMKAMLAIFSSLLALWIVSPSFRIFAIEWLALNPDRVIAKLYLWQLVTSIFLHGGLPHFLGNMLFFWFFGSALAAHWSRREFLVFFFFCGIGAALCTLAYDMLLGRAIPSLGASGAIFGLMAAYAMIFGERMILLFMMIPIKARHLVGVLMAIEFLLVLGGTSDGIGHVAHLSGALCGAAYLFVVRRWRTRPAAAPDALQSRFSSLEIGSD